MNPNVAIFHTGVILRYAWYHWEYWIRSAEIYDSKSIFNQNFILLTANHYKLTSINDEPCWIKYKPTN